MQINDNNTPHKSNACPPLPSSESPIKMPKETQKLPSGQTANAPNNADPVLARSRGRPPSLPSLPKKQGKRGEEGETPAETSFHFFQEQDHELLDLTFNIVKFEDNSVLKSHSPVTSQMQSVKFCGGTMGARVLRCKITKILGSRSTHHLQGFQPCRPVR